MDRPGKKGLDGVDSVDGSIAGSETSPRCQVEDPAKVSGVRSWLRVQSLGVLLLWSSFGGNRFVRNAAICDDTDGIALVPQPGQATFLAPTRVGTAAFIRALARETSRAQSAVEMAGTKIALLGAIRLHLAAALCDSRVVSFFQVGAGSANPADGLQWHTVERGTMDPIGSPVDASAVRITVDEGQGLALLGDGWRRVARMSVEDATSLRALREDPSLCPTPAPTPNPSGQVTSCADVGTCTIVDDPHITVFDKAQVSLLSVGHTRDDHSLKEDYRFGDIWLVKNPLVSIQAQYLPDEALSEKNLYVKAVAVGGPFVRGSKLIIGALDDAVTWDGAAILEPPASRRGPVTGVSRFEVAGLLKASQSFDGQVIVELPMSVTLTVRRKRTHVNVFIQMPPLEGGQEGMCGNFNGHAGDDSLELLEGRSDLRVEPQASIFVH